MQMLLTFNLHPAAATICSVAAAAEHPPAAGGGGGRGGGGVNVTAARGHCPFNITVSLKGQRELYTSIIVVLFHQVAWVHQEIIALFCCP